MTLFVISRRKNAVHSFEAKPTLNVDGGAVAMTYLIF